MMQALAYLLVGPASIDGGGAIAASPNRTLLVGSGPLIHRQNRFSHRRLRSPVAASSRIDDEQDHYAVLGVSPYASCSDIKKAYRLLALKYHPDVSKDSRADKLFKSIRLAYDILSNESKRKQYDQSLRLQEDTGRATRGYRDYNPEFDDGVRIYNWDYLRRKMKRERYWERYNAGDKSSFYSETGEEFDEKTPDEERGSFTEVLTSAFLSLFLMRTIGIQLTLAFSSGMALLDEKLDAGYKVGYLIAWALGGRGGILLTLCLSFASWACGKTSSGAVALVVLAMWVGSNLARFTPFPQGAVLTLVYMCIKLQNDIM